MTDDAPHPVYVDNPSVAMVTATHLLLYNPFPGHRTGCGLGLFNRGARLHFTRSSAATLTKEPSEVTCERCLDRMAEEVEAALRGPDWCSSAWHTRHFTGPPTFDCPICGASLQQ